MTDRVAKLPDRIFWILIAATALLPAIGALTTMTALQDWRYENDFLHIIIEVLGAVIGLLVVFLITVDRAAHKLTANTVLFIPAGLIAMATFDIFHALHPVNNNMLWFRCLALVSGGIFFAMVWTPSRLTEKFRSLPVFVFIAAMISAFWAVLFPDQVPAMMDARTGAHRHTVHIMNLIGGTGFLLAGIYFIRQYFSVPEGTAKDLKYAGLALLSILSGMTGLMFELLFAFSTVWDATWWWWHIIRLLVYVSLLLMFLVSLEKSAADKASYFRIEARHLQIPMLLISGTLTILLGTGIMMAWHAGYIPIIQIRPDFVPMHYNTALAFALSGLSLLAFAYTKPRLRVFTATLIMALGAFSLLQYIFATDFGFDRLLIDPQIMADSPHPIRMAPNTALCFLLGGLAFMAFTTKYIPTIVIVAVILTISLLSLTGYFIGIESLHGWAGYTPMAPLTATGFLILAAGIFITGLQARSRKFIDLWHSAPFMVAAIVMTLSLTAWYNAKELNDSRNRQYFIDLIDDSQDILNQRVLLYEQSLRGAAGLFYASQDVTRDEWRVYVRSLDIAERLPGIKGMGYIDYVHAQDLDDYLAVARADGAPGFQYHPAKTSEEKYIIRYIEPLEVNRPSLGFDIGFEQHRRAAAKMARDIGSPQLSNKIHLMQDTMKRPGFLLFIPVYKTGMTPPTIDERREHIAGWVFAPFIGERFLADIASPQIAFKVYDGNNTDEKKLIYDSAAAHVNASTHHNHNNLHNTTRLDIAGQTWTILWHPTHSFQPPAAPGSPLLILLAGTVFALFLASFFYLLSRLYGRTSKTMHENAEKIDMLMISTVEGIITINDQGLIETMNPAAECMFGYDPGEALGRNVDILVQKEASTYSCGEKITHYIETGESNLLGIANEVTGLRKNGTTFPLELTFSKFTVGGQLTFSALLRDITNRKNDEQEREDLINRLARSNEELERFAYVASHDLQEPVRMVNSFTTLLKNKYAAQLDDTARQYIDFACDGARRMSDLVQDLLEYARIEQGSGTYEDVDCEAILEYVKDNLAESIKDSGAMIRSSRRLPVIRAHALRFSRILENLISNAIKYQPPGQKPVIDISYREDDNFWHFYVQDNGIGIAPDYHEQIYQPFRRLHANDEYAGTGIGLPICRKLVETFGGTIRVESEPGQGSLFIFTIAKNI